MKFKESSFIGGVALSALLLSCNSIAAADSSNPSKITIQSIHTDLDVGSCKEEIDRSDPNETPYLVCPGVAGYKLIQRQVESGRESVDVMDVTLRVFPLNYQEFVTRYMSNLFGKAEWRVATKDGHKVPIAVIIHVQSREDIDNPEKVTHTYLAVAKITPKEACVTDKITEGTQSEADVRRVADSAEKKPCLKPQAPLKVDGIRW